METETVTFEVTPERAEYLRQCLARPLCLSCHREDDECDADPCLDKQIDSGLIAICDGCKTPFDPHHLTDGKCPECQPNRSALHAVEVYETIQYTIYVEARNTQHVELAVGWMDTHDWEAPRQIADEFGFEVSQRSWDVEEMANPKEVEAVKADEIIQAHDYDDLT